MISLQVVSPGQDFRLHHTDSEVSMTLSVLIIDDEEDIGWSFRESLGNLGMDVRFTTNPEEGLIMMRYAPDVILLDYKMPRMNGLEVLKRIKAEIPDQIIVMMTAYANIENAVEAMKLGAFHYIQKPFQVGDLIPILDIAGEVIDMKRKLDLMSDGNESGDFGLLDGKSVVMQSVFRRAKKVANKRSTSVLVLGESGTGKELLAKTIHKLSERSEKLFIALNCSAIPETLLESELFGYEPGAFTGAIRLKKGMFEVADGGTLFLDEIGDMPLGLQSKILRVLEDGSFSRLGADKEILKVDVRIIAASNQNLEYMIKKGTFRDDLFYRLNTFTIEMPPLRERGDDVIDLALKFINRFNTELKINIRGLNPEAARAIKSFNWPGNVRQLRNAIESAMIESEGNDIDVTNLPQTVIGGSVQKAKKIADSFTISGFPTLDEIKRAYIIQVLGKCKTDQDAADILGISRRTITRLKKEISSGS